MEWMGLQRFQVYSQQRQLGRVDWRKVLVIYMHAISSYFTIGYSTYPLGKS